MRQRLSDETYARIEKLAAEGVSYKDIAREVGCAAATVSVHMIRRGVRRFSRATTRVVKGAIRKRRAGLPPEPTDERLLEALARRGREWGDHNEQWRKEAEDAHNGTGGKWKGRWPADTPCPIRGYNAIAVDTWEPA